MITPDCRSLLLGWSLQGKRTALLCHSEGLWEEEEEEEGWTREDHLPRWTALSMTPWRGEKKIKIAKIIDFKSIDIAACFGFVSFFRGDLSSTETPVYLHYIVHVPLYLLYQSNHSMLLNYYYYVSYYQLNENKLSAFIFMVSHNWQNKTRL